MPGPEVMLASATRDEPRQTLARLASEGTWWLELKFDGVRAVVSRSSGGAVRIYNRRRVDITHRYPDVVHDVSVMGFVGVLDGEIVVMRDGRPDFSAVHMRDAQSRPRVIATMALEAPATFVPFDVLEFHGSDQRALPYVHRRGMLTTMHPSISVASQNGELMWQFVEANRLEGLVAKRGESQYRPGRHRSWLKIKNTKRVSVLVTGVKPGQGSRGPIGSLYVGLWDPQTQALVPVGSVGSGLSEATMRLVGERLASGAAPLVVEVEYLEVSASRQLRMPVFLGIRDDVEPDSCTLDTLTL